MSAPGLSGVDAVNFVLYCRIDRRLCLVKLLVKLEALYPGAAFSRHPAGETPEWVFFRIGTLAPCSRGTQSFFAGKLKVLRRSCTIEPMATYVISDIHGALTEFRNLLEKIDFHYDGRDALYLLGDYCDWGTDPIGTLQLVKEMDEEYPFVHWEQREISVWMAALPYSAQVTVNGVSYLLSHAYPYFDDVQCSPEEDVRRKTDAVWRRLMIRENPFAGYTGSRHYDRFICGHTITEFYFYKLRFERGWPVRKPDPSVRNRIFRGERFIDIDCGAKCMSCAEDPSAALRRGAGRAQLACLRLDDMHEFYQHPVKHRIPQFDLQDPTKPFARLAELEPGRRKWCCRR